MKIHGLFQFPLLVMGRNNTEVVVSLLEKVAPGLIIMMISGSITLEQGAFCQV